MEHSQSRPVVSGVVVTTTHVRRLAVAAYLARFKGQSRIHTGSDLRAYERVLSTGRDHESGGDLSVHAPGYSRALVGPILEL